jgi:hypothetical protein
LPTIEVLDGHAFEQVIDGVHLETQGDLPMPLDAAIALKIANTAGIQDNFRQWQRSLRRRLGGWGARRLLGPGKHAENI